MKKIAIITLTHVYNYGNRLQNYALQELLKDMGYHVETIYNDVGSIKSKGLIILKECLYCGKYAKLRKKAFKEFNRKYIIWSNIKASNYIISDNRINGEYDYFISGSDQICNPYFSYFGFYFLDFVECDNKKLSYAASYGVTKIPEEKKLQYKKWLSDFKAISVREEQGVELCEKLGINDAVRVLDPTLMLSADRWNSMARKPHGFNEKNYILLYFLGEIPTLVHMEIQHYKKRGEKIIYLENENKRVCEIKSKSLFSADPMEFIWLIKNCALLLTDSFHGVVYSILFKKNFWVFDRKGEDIRNEMSSRITSLLLMVDIKDRMNPMKICDTNIDYSNIDELLDIERKKGLEYLMKNLE